MTARDALVAVATLLAPEIPQVSRNAAAALDDPAAYVAEHADRLDDRGIDEPFPLLPWIALVDALTDHDLLAEVDWKEAADEIAGRLRALHSAPAGVAWQELAESELPTYEFLELAGGRLLGTGTALAVLDIESDCYPLVLLPATRADDLVTAAKAAGFAAEVFGR
ncbi:hypothetical protein M8542_31840 [Amycolatopsis sp. OK19-0408]|uniref:DUF6630 domain-containing protein n=1 Tax=Amycolatopsis iheyensis TaxID=2945988 RepID=A0A9X2NIN8_9PSEU|nr:hypothetical protein [Amycolatopsis iheyensis]MCR6487430.1 hypothetical protein [Amycolatopsis iheyensis]